MWTLWLLICLPLVLVFKFVFGELPTESVPTTEATHIDGFHFGPYKSNFRCPKKYGYFADIENNCRVFHVCNPRHFLTGKTDIELFSFLCPPNTIFNQQTMNCARREESVPCNEAIDFYFVNDIADYGKTSTLRIRNVIGDFDYNAIDGSLLKGRLKPPSISRPNFSQDPKPRLLTSFSSPAVSRRPSSMPAEKQWTVKSIQIEINGPRYSFNPSYPESLYNVRSDANASLNSAATTVTALLLEAPTPNPNVPKQIRGQRSTSLAASRVFTTKDSQLDQLLKDIMNEASTTTTTTSRPGAKFDSNRQTTDSRTLGEKTSPSFEVNDLKKPRRNVQTNIGVPSFISSAEALDVLRQSINDAMTQSSPPLRSSANGDPNRYQRLIIVSDQPLTRTVASKQAPINLKRGADKPEDSTAAPLFLSRSVNNLPGKLSENFERISLKDANADSNGEIDLKGGSRIPKASRKIADRGATVPLDSLKTATDKLSDTPPAGSFVRVSNQQGSVDLKKPPETVHFFGQRIKKLKDAIPNLKQPRETLAARNNLDTKTAEEATTPATEATTKQTLTTTPKIVQVSEISFGTKLRDLILKEPFEREVFIGAIDLPLKSTTETSRDSLKTSKRLSETADTPERSATTSEPSLGDASRIPTETSQFTQSGTQAPTVVGRQPLTSSVFPPATESSVDSLIENDQTADKRKVRQDETAALRPKRRRKSLESAQLNRPTTETPAESQARLKEENGGRKKRSRVKRIKDVAGVTLAPETTLDDHPIPSKPLFVWETKDGDPVFFNIPLL